MQLIQGEILRKLELEVDDDIVVSVGERGEVVSVIVFCVRVDEAVNWKSVGKCGSYVREGILQDLWSQERWS